MSTDVEDKTAKPDKYSCHQDSLHEALDYFQCLPSEILATHIFPSLDGVTFVRCRRVCKRWGAIVDDMMHSTALWNKFCLDEYGDSSETTQRNCSPEMSQFHVYRNLYGWGHLASARRTNHHISDGPRRPEVLQVTNDGTLISVHEDAIMFYDLDTLQIHPRRKEISGRYLDYQENDRVVVLLCNNHDLHITRKMIFTPGPPESLLLYGVRGFFLDKKYLYYQVERQMVYRCKLDHKSFAPQLMGTVPGAIVQLNVFNSKIYARSYNNKYWVHAAESFIKIDEELYMDHYFGILGTYNNSYKVDVSKHLIRLVRLVIKKEELPTISNTYTYNKMLILGSPQCEIFVFCLQQQRLLLKYSLSSFQSEVCTMHSLIPSLRNINRIQVHESRDGYTIVGTTEIGNSVTKFYHIP